MAKKEKDEKKDEEESDDEIEIREIKEEEPETEEANLSDNFSEFLLNQNIKAPVLERVARGDDSDLEQITFRDRREREEDEREVNYTETQKNYGETGTRNVNEERRTQYSERPADYATFQKDETRGTRRLLRGTENSRNRGDVSKMERGSFESLDDENPNTRYLTKKEYET